MPSNKRRKYDPAPAEDANMTEIHSNSHSLKAMSIFAEMWRAEKLTDVTLHVGNQKIRAHKLVLCSSSYFRSMLAGPLADKGEVIMLPEVDSEHFEIALSFLYTGVIQVTQANAVGILILAQRFDIQSLLVPLCSYLSTRLCPTSCVGTFITADSLELASLKKESFGFVCANFATPEVTVDLNGLELPLLKEVLLSDDLVVPSEMSVLNLADAWLRHDECRQTPGVCEAVLGLVRYKFIDPHDLTFLSPKLASGGSPKLVCTLVEAATVEHLQLESRRSLTHSKKPLSSPRCYGAFNWSKVCCTRTVAIEGESVPTPLIVAGGKLLVVSGGNVDLWDMETWVCEKKISSSSLLMSSGPEIHHHWPWLVSCMAVAGEKVFIGRYYDNTINVWDMASWTYERTLEGHDRGMISLLVCGSKLISGSRDNTVKVWDLGGTWACERTLVGHTGSVKAMVASGGKLITGSEDAIVKVWDMGNWECEQTLEEHAGYILAMVIGGEKLITGSQDGTIKIWDMGTWECDMTLKEHANFSVTMLDVQGDKLISGSYDNTLKIWNTRTWECERSIEFSDDEGRPFGGMAIQRGGPSMKCKLIVTSQSNLVSGAVGGMISCRYKLNIIE